MGKLSEWAEARIAVALRWLLQRPGAQHQKLGFVVLSDYTTVSSPIRPPSGEAVVIDWSVWFGFGRHWRGYGGVRTWARYDDLEIWIAGMGPFTSFEGRIDFGPRVTPEGERVWTTIPIEKLEFLTVGNIAQNPRAASGFIQVFDSAGVVGSYSFDEIDAGHTGRTSVSNTVADQKEIVLRSLQFKTVPVGAQRVERLWGVPEWKVGK